MAEINKLIPFVLKWEGGFVNDPLDKGGVTYMGITIGTFRKFYGRDKTVDDLKSVTKNQWLYIFKNGFWDKWRADEIKSQSVANMLVDWFWHSGINGIKIPQRLLGVMDDGIVGKITIAAVNNAEPRVFFNALRDARLQYVEDIVKRNPSQQKFLKGWKNRIESMEFNY